MQTIFTHILRSSKYLSIILLIVASLIVVHLYHQNKGLKAEISVYSNNLNAYQLENSALKDKTRVFELTIDQLNYFSDSILLHMRETQEQLKIKDKTIKQLQYQLSIASKTDTLILRDTIFRDKSFVLDTLFGDKWFRQKLLLKYPNIIASSPQVTLKNHVLIHEEKETIKPPKKFFLWRWFQRKHKVLHVNVYEENPYVKDSISRFIIIKE